MRVGIHVAALVLLLAPSLVAADNSCSEFKGALETLDLTRSVRKSVEVMVSTTEDAFRIIPKLERDKVREDLKNDVKDAYYTAYSEYRDANFSAQDAAQRAAVNAGISNDTSIQTVITLGNATVEVIGTIVPKESDQRERQHDDVLNALDSVVDRFFALIANAACS